MFSQLPPEKLEALLKTLPDTIEFANAEDLPPDVRDRVFLGGERVRYEFGPDEQNRWFVAYAGPVYKSGEVVAAIVIRREISERKRAEIEHRRLVVALARRNTQLQTAAEVSKSMTTILEPQTLLVYTVTLIQTRFDFYYVGIFLVEDDYAVLKAGTDEAGLKMLSQGHRLKVGGESMIGWCVANKQARIALDVGREAVRFDNPMLPLTRSEMALPLLSRGECIGALTVQSSQPTAFSNEDIAVLQSMVDQLAIALENARLYEQVQSYASELEARVMERTRALAGANERLQELDKLKSKFVSDVSHELRTPVTNLMMYIDLLEKGKVDRQNHYISVLKREVARLSSLVESILDLSRLELNHRTITLGPVNLNRVIEQVLVAHQPRFESTGLQLETELSDSLPMVRGDDNQLAQVVTNLVSNAVNYTREGFIRVTTRHIADMRQVLLLVEDSGIGIDPEDIPHLFDRFYRGQRISHIPGSGLGLGIVKEIVDIHQGKIGVDSVVGQGSRFRIWLPVMPTLTSEGAGAAT